MQNLNREQAITFIGEDAINLVERANCDFSIAAPLNGLVEFTASIEVGDDTLIAYYYQPQDAVTAAGELDELDWSIDHFDIVAGA